MKEERGARIVVAGVCALLVVIAVATACGGSEEPQVPQVEITGVDARDEYSLTDYRVHVDCTLRNKGGAGVVTVEAELSLNGWWKKEVLVDLAAGEARTVTLTFEEPKFLTDALANSRYQCSARNR